jgi:hypothetical protein
VPYTGDRSVVVRAIKSRANEGHDRLAKALLKGRVVFGRSGRVGASFDMLCTRVDAVIGRSDDQSVSKGMTVYHDDQT